MTFSTLHRHTLVSPIFLNVFLKHETPLMYIASVSLKLYEGGFQNGKQ